MRLIPAVSALSLILAGCAVFDASTKTSQEINSIPEAAVLMSERIPGRFSLLTPQATGVVAVYEDSNRTMIQFAQDVPADLMLVDAAGKVLPFDRYGAYAIVPGQHDGILLRSGGGQSYASTLDSGKVRMSDEALAKSAGAGIGPINGDASKLSPINSPANTAALPTNSPDIGITDVVANDASPQELSPAQLLSEAEHDLINIEAQISPAKPTFTVVHDKKTVAALDAKVDGMNATTVRVRFGVGRTKVKLPEAVREAFKKAASASGFIEVRGRTDASGSARTNSRIAYDRAIAAKTYLMSLGVPAEKIRVNALAMTDYVADNVTADGRANNRRVDFVFVPAEPDAVKVSLETPKTE